MTDFFLNSVRFLCKSCDLWLTGCQLIVLVNIFRFLLIQNSQEKQDEGENAISNQKITNFSLFHEYFSMSALLNA